MKQNTKIISCVLLLSLVLVGLGETDSLVLCIGDDGHVALEDVRTGVCNYTLAKLADELGLSPTCAEIRDKARCCPCADMNLPGKALDYPEIPGPDIVCILEPAEFATPLFAPDCADFAYIPLSEFIPRRPPPDPLDDVARIVLRSVVILA